MILYASKYHYNSILYNVMFAAYTYKSVPLQLLEHMRRVVANEYNKETDSVGYKYRNY